MEKVLRVVNCVLLLAILIVLIFIMEKMPPNVNDLIKARNNKTAMKKLRYKVPLVRIFGAVDVDVSNEVDVNVTNEVDVNVTNTPLEVITYESK